MVSIQDFNLYRKDRSTRGGGIAAYVSSSIQCKRLIDKELYESITEAMWIHLKPHRLPRSVSTILLGVVYHSPQATADDNNTLYNHVQETVDCFLKQYPDALICIIGDFNPNSTNISSPIFKRMTGLTQIIKVLTRDSGILDWCLTNRPKTMSEPKQLPKVGRSDHYCVLIQQTTNCSKHVKRTTSKRDTRSSRIRDFGRSSPRSLGMKYF